MNQKIKLIFLLLIFFPGFLLALWSFYGHHTPSGRLNHGLVFSPPMNFSWPQEANKSRHWTMFIVLPGLCDSLCRQQLFLMRQMRLGVGSKAQYIDRAVVFSQNRPPSQLAAAKKSSPMVKFIAISPAQLNALPLTRGFYFSDPRGLIVMAWPVHLQPNHIMEDIDRLMKFYS